MAKKVILAVLVTALFAIYAAPSHAATSRQWAAWWAIDRHCGDGSYPFGPYICNWKIAPDSIHLFDCWTNYKCWNMGATHSECSTFKCWLKGSNGHIQKWDNKVSYFREWDA